MKVLNVRKLTQKYIQCDISTETENFFVKVGTEYVLVHNSPALVMGINPENGKFFVAKKGIFNKTPKLYYSLRDIETDVSGDLAEKLSIAFVECKKLNLPRGVFQGDLLFTKKDLKYETIEGRKYLTFHPNTILYTIDVESALVRTIERANLGIVWHTIYEGDTIASLHAVYGKQILGEHIKTSHPGIWMQDASLSLRDVTGIATFSESERIAFDQLLTQIGKKFRNVPAATLNAIHKNPDLLELVHRHHNSLIRNKVAVNNIREYVHSLFVFAETKFKKDIEEKKLARSKDAIAQRRQQVMNFFTAHPEKDLLGLFELNSLLKEAKEIIIKKLNNVSALGTFLRTRNGFRTTVPEGFVAIRAAGRTAVKLVDRLEFSTANFSPEIIKGFER